MYGHCSAGSVCPGICFWSTSVLNSTYFAFDVGSKRLRNSLIG